MENSSPSTKTLEFILRAAHECPCGQQPAIERCRAVSVSKQSKYLLSKRGQRPLHSDVKVRSNIAARLSTSSLRLGWQVTTLQLTGRRRLLRRFKERSMMQAELALTRRHPGDGEHKSKKSISTVCMCHTPESSHHGCVLQSSQLQWAKIAKRNRSLSTKTSSLRTHHTSKPVSMALGKKERPTQFDWKTMIPRPSRP